MKRRTRRAAITIAVIAALLATSGGAAFAYWKAGGSGSGSGSTGSTTALSIAPGTASAGLYPGSTATVTVVVSNPNTAPVVITSLVSDTTQGTTGFSVDAGHSGCSVAALSYTTQSNGGAGWVVPRKVGVTNGSLTITLPAALSLSTAAANACQGASFTTFVRAT